MANTKISEFSPATTLAGTELIPVIQGADNKNTTPAELKKYVFKSQANIWGYVTTHADLSLTTTDTDPEVGDLVGVNTTTGTWILGTQRKLGFYKRLATTGTVDQQYGTSPYAAYVPNADVIGDEAYTEKNYITEENTIRENIDALDVAVADKQAALTFGIADTNAVRIDDASASSGEFAKFTANGVEGVAASTVLYETIVIACSDETTDLTIGTAKVTFRMPFAMTLLSGKAGLMASVNTAPVGSTIQVDVNEGGSSILSTILSIDASEETSDSAATEVVISDTALAKDAEITIDIDQIGSSTAGKGLKVMLMGYRT